MMTTALPPTSGVSILGGKSRVFQQQNIIGYCPQDNLFWDKLTVYRHLFYFGLLKVIIVVQSCSCLIHYSLCYMIVNYKNKNSQNLMDNLKTY